MFTLSVFWNTGEKENHFYKTREAAEKAEKGYKTAFGSQVLTDIHTTTLLENVSQWDNAIKERGYVN